MRTLRASLLRHLLAVSGLLLCALFATLATWQYGRGEFKEGWLAQVEAARDAPARPIAQTLADPGSAELAVAVAGQLELRAGPRLLLDNQQREGRVGVREYALARPLPVVEDDAAWLLVDMGWLLLPPDRSLPSLPALPAELDATGLLTPLPGQGLRLGQNPPAGVGTALLNYLDTVELGAQLGVAIRPRLLRLDPAIAIGHARDLDVLPNTLPPERHRGYALQWAGLSLAAFFITFLLYFRSRG
ncbi:SURF1 family protein [Aquimonas sp.]|uniref:SURF1 family protein n=1 Tax=Aquimonas sp. TaxID=1872588 RepID=UPI0037BF95B3